MVLCCLVLVSEFPLRFSLRVVILLLVLVWFGLLSGHLLGNSKSYKLRNIHSVDHMFSLKFDYL